MNPTIAPGDLLPISERQVERPQAGTDIDFFSRMPGPLGTVWGGIDEDSVLLRFDGKVVGTVWYHLDGRRKKKCAWMFWECWERDWPFDVLKGYCDSLEEGMAIIESVFISRTKET